MYTSKLQGGRVRIIGKIGAALWPIYEVEVGFSLHRQGFRGGTRLVTG